MRLAPTLAALVAFALASTLAAQPPFTGPAGPGGPGSPAEFLLGHTGDLQLTDAQVVRLAAIARRSQERQRAMAARFDSLQSRERTAAATDTSGRRMRVPGAGVEQAMQRFGEQMRADRRDAIAVLTPDQQATAWDLVASRGFAGGPRGGPRGMRGGPEGQRDGVGPRRSRDDGARPPRRPYGDNDREQYRRPD